MSKHERFSARARFVAQLRRRLHVLAFTSLYRYGGRIYDVITVLLFGDAWEHWRCMALPFAGNGPVLDLGCGTGVLVSTIAGQGRPVVGIDREPSMLARASRRNGTEGKLVRACASSLPFLRGSFQTCVATFPSSFISAPETLDEVARVLRPTGTFVVVLTGQTEHRTWWRLPIRLMLRAFYGSQNRHRFPDHTPLRHPLLGGEWTWISEGEDRALVWVATRAGHQDRV